MALRLGAGLARALGVSRVARVTGLDRTGVQVACAVRPRAHVLQVCNGKGEDAASAQNGALLEAAELWAAERVDPAGLVWGSLEELRATSEAEVWDAGELGSAGALIARQLWSPRTRLAWSRGAELTRGSAVLVPAQALHCPPPGAPPLGPAIVAWTSNGMGAHPERDAALLHALCEAIERDQLARALPQGWTGEAVAARMLSRDSLAARVPRTAARADAIERGRFQTFLFDFTPGAGSLGVPLAAALLFDRDRGPVSLAAGYACGADPDEALLGALLEAAQSRLTDIHGARDDVAAAEPDATEWLRRTCEGVRPKRSVEAMPRIHAGSAGSIVQAIVAELARRGLRVAAFELAPPGFPVHVIKVVVPGFLVSELL